MPTTNFVNGTVIQPSWLNGVDSASYQFLAGVGGTNTIVATGPSSYTAYLQQSGFILNPQNSNTGAVTLNINNLGAIAVTKYGTTPLVTGDLQAGVLAYVMYDGTRFQLLNPQTVNTNVTGRLIGVQRMTASGTYTATAGTNSVIVVAVGAGGGGGGCGATAAGQVSVGGGGGGGSCVIGFIASNPTGTAVTIGTAGAGGVGAAGGVAGGSTLFGAFLTAPGGNGGQGLPAGAPLLFASSGAGGAAVSFAGATLVWASGGHSGDYGLAPTLGSGGSGAGGGSGFGGAGGNPVFNAAGQAPANFAGGGGSGAHSTASVAARNGGTGAPGVVIVYEYS